MGTAANGMLWPRTGTVPAVCRPKMYFSQPSADDVYTVARRREGFHVVKRFPQRSMTRRRVLRSRPAV